MRSAYRIAVFIIMLAIVCFVPLNSHSLSQESPITTVGGEKILATFAKLINQIPFIKEKGVSLGPTKPDDALSTPDGGWVTPLQLTDIKGHKLIVHLVNPQQNLTRLINASKIYHKAFNSNNTIFVPVCPQWGTGVYQEGGNWTISSTSPLASDVMGYQVIWEKPSANVTCTSTPCSTSEPIIPGGGIYYNPVNMYYPVTQLYVDNFYQVTYGVGPGIQDSWQIWTSGFSDSSGDRYYFQHLDPNQFPPPSDTTYRVSAALESSSPLQGSSANPSALVVQIETTSYNPNTANVYYYDLNFTPQSGKVFGFSSYQDEYTMLPGGHYSLTADQVSNPAVMESIGNKFTNDSSLVTGFKSFDNLNNQSYYITQNGVAIQTSQVLYPMNGSTNILQNAPGCYYTPEFGSAATSILIISMLAIILFTIKNNKFQRFS